MSTPQLIILLQDLLHEVRLIRRHLDPPITAEERRVFMEAVTEQAANQTTKLKQRKKKGSISDAK